MAKARELLPCPFCGNEPERQHFNISPHLQGRIICSCGAEMRQGRNQTSAELVAAWNARTTHGTLTAEQVLEAWTGNLKRDCLYDPPMPDWQAIADELNATLGSERDTIYNAGFDNGVKATLQQLDGLLIETDSAVEIQAWVDEQWKECES